MIGGDAEIGALWAAVIEGALFHIQLPGGSPIATSFGIEAQCFRGSVAVPGRKLPARPLVGVSAEVAKTKPWAGRGGARPLFCAAQPRFCPLSVAPPLAPPPFPRRA